MVNFVMNNIENFIRIINDNKDNNKKNNMVSKSRFYVINTKIYIYQSCDISFLLIFYM